MGLAEPEAAALLVAACAWKCAWRLQSCMHISLGMCRSQRGEAVALPNCIRQKRRCMSGVTAIVRTASRHGPLVAVADQCDQTASPDRLRPSRYSFFVAVCMVSLSEKSQHCVSVCVEYMQCMLAKWLILSLALSFGNSLDRSRICADRIARFRFSSCVRAIIVHTHARRTPSKHNASYRSTYRLL